MDEADLEGLAAFTAYISTHDPLDLNTADIEKVVNSIKENWSKGRIEKLIRGLNTNEDNKS